MKALAGLAVCVLLVAADKSKKPDGALEGVWKVQALLANGSEIDDAKGSKFTFKGTKLARQTPDGEETYTFKLDPSKKPAEVDFTPDQGDNKGKMLKGIYVVKDGELKVCLTLNPEAKRPSEFASKDGEEFILITLKQDKK